MLSRGDTFVCVVHCLTSFPPMLFTWQSRGECCKDSDNVSFESDKDSDHK